QRSRQRRWHYPFPTRRSSDLGAGHDAVYMAKLAPSGMIFIPCKDGISHNEIEDAKPEHITAGCNVLLHAMMCSGLSSSISLWLIDRKSTRLNSRHQIMSYVVF